jgi:hypothetical protein
VGDILAVLFRVYMDVLAVMAQFLDLILIADEEALEQERGLGPRAIQARHIHADFKIGGIHFKLFLYFHFALLQSGGWQTGLDSMVRRPRF